MNFIRNIIFGLLLLCSLGATFIYVDPPAGGGGPFGDHSTLTTGLTAAYDFEEASANAQDSHGTNHFDVEGGTPDYQQTGKDGFAISYLSGSAEYIGETGLGQLPGDDGNFSISMWVEVDNTSQTHTFLDYHNTELFIRWRTTSGGQWQAALTDDTDTVRSVFYGATPTTNQFYHLVVTFDGSDWKFFIDGIYRGNYSTGTHNLHMVTSVRIGQLQATASDYLSGSMDALYIWTKALTDGSPSVDTAASGEVGDLYNSGTGLFYND